MPLGMAVYTTVFPFATAYSALAADAAPTGRGVVGTPGEEPPILTISPTCAPPPPRARHRLCRDGRSAFSHPTLPLCPQPARTTALACGGSLTWRQRRRQSPGRCPRDRGRARPARPSPPHPAPMLLHSTLSLVTEPVLLALPAPFWPPLPAASRAAAVPPSWRRAVVRRTGAADWRRPGGVGPTRGGVGRQLGGRAWWQRSGW